MDASEFKLWRSLLKRSKAPVQEPEPARLHEKSFGIFLKALQVSDDFADFVKQLRDETYPEDSVRRCSRRRGSSNEPPAEISCLFG